MVHVDANDRVIGFLEKPADPPGMPDKPDKAFASMGIYVFRTKFLFEELRRDAADEASDHDFGKDIIPYLVKHGQRRRASIRAFVCPIRARRRSLLARRRYDRRVLGSEHRPDRLRSGTRSVRHELADLDLRRNHAAGKIHP